MTTPQPTINRFTVTSGYTSPMRSGFAVEQLIDGGQSTFSLKNRCNKTIANFESVEPFTLPGFEGASFFKMITTAKEPIPATTVYLTIDTSKEAFAIVCKDGKQGVWTSKEASNFGCPVDLPSDGFAITSPLDHIIKAGMYIERVSSTVFKLQELGSSSGYTIRGMTARTADGDAEFFSGEFVTESGNDKLTHQVCLVFDTYGYRFVGLCSSVPTGLDLGGEPNTLVFGGESDGGYNSGLLGEAFEREATHPKPRPREPEHSEREHSERKHREERPLGPSRLGPSHPTRPSRAYKTPEVSMPSPLSRELLMASLLATHSDKSSRAYCRSEISLEASEPGWADLSRLQLLAVDQDPKHAKQPVDVLPWSTVEAIRVHNTRELIRGQGHTVGAPAGPFSPFRQYGPIQLGRWWLEGGNLITIRLCTETRPGGGDDESDNDSQPNLAYSAAVPFLPDNPRHFDCPKDLEGRDRAYIASPAYEPWWQNDAARATLELRFDQDGIVDLDTLQVQVRHHEPTDYGTPPVATAIVESIELPTRQELIVGGSYGEERDLAAPAGIFASLGRRFDWVRFGKLDVSTRNTLRVRVRLLMTEHALHTAGSTVSAGIQFYPSKKRTH